MRYAIAVLLALTFPSGGDAQNLYADQVLEQLNSVEYGRALQETHDKQFGSLRNNHYSTLSYSLQAGTSYEIYGRCDEDCSDLDLALYQNGMKIREDIDVDAFPVVAFSPRRTGIFQLRVHMYSCDLEPCHYGVAIIGE